MDLNTETFPVKRKTSKKKAAGSNRNVMIAGGIGAVVLLLLLIFMLSAPGPRGANRVADPDAIATISPAKTSPAKTIKTDVDTATPKVSEAPSTTPPKLATTLPKSTPRQLEKLVSTPSGEPVDLLAKIDFARDVVRGEWKRADSTLVGGQQSRIYLPAKLPEDYQLKFAVRRIEGADALQFGFMMAGRQGIVAFDGWDGKISGLYADGQAADNTWTAWRETLLKNHELSDDRPDNSPLTFSRRV